MPTTEWNAELYRERSSLQQAMAAEVLQALELTLSDRVLDVGCGDGKITSEIARRVPNGCVVGVDASSKMIELASQNIRPNLHFGVADARSLPLGDEFDLVVSFNALHWIHEQYLVLASIHKSVKPGGPRICALYLWARAKASRQFWKRHEIRQPGASTFVSFAILTSG